MAKHATRYQVRIIAGALRGRKLTVPENPRLRPLADRVRAALFSILGNAVPDRPFIDLFAGSGAVGLEALSRGASAAIFVEREPGSAAALRRHVEGFGLTDRASVLRADVYRWADNWRPPAGPVCLFLGPPYREFTEHPDAIAWLIATLRQKAPLGSVLIVQSESGTEAASPDAEQWDIRRYGRTRLAFWTKTSEFQPLDWSPPTHVNSGGD